MPEGEVYAYRPVVKVEGSLLPDGVAERLMEVYADDSVHLPGLLMLRFSDPEDTVLTDARLKIGAAVSFAVGSSSPGTPEPVMEATVTSLEREIDSHGITTVVRALDARRVLQGSAKVVTFVDQTASDIVRRVAREVGLACQVDSIGPVYKHLIQDGLSDWEFLTWLAARHGAVLSMTGKTLRLRKPTQASSAPTNDPDPLVINASDHVISLRATVTASGQVGKVEARGWNPKEKKEVVHTADASTTSASLTSTPAALAPSGKPEVVSTPGLSEVKQVEAAAAARMSGRAGSFAELEARLRGNAKLYAGAAVSLKGAGKNFDGKYVLTAVRHSFDEVAGYVTDVTVAHISDRSTYGVLAGAVEPARGPRGLLPAVVTNLKDPEKQGRVKVQFPTLAAGEESWWARVVQAGAGKGRGTVLLPEVGDEVLVAFAGTGLEAPYVLGGLYNGKDLPVPGFDQHLNRSGAVVRRGVTSRTGMSVEVLEDGTDVQLNIRDKDSKQRITVTQSPTGGIEIASEGTIKLTGQVVEIAAEQDLKLSGTNVKIAAKANVDLDAKANATIKAGTNASLEAQAAAAVKSTGIGELSASGPLTVRGAIVNIN